MSETTRELPPYLAECVRRGVLDDEAARRVERFRRSSGKGVVDSLAGMSGDVTKPGGGMLPSLTPSDGVYVPLLLQSRPDRTLTFDTLVPCKANDFALEVSRVVATDATRRRTYTPLYVHSEVGMGKTHLLSAIATAASQDHAVVFCNVADLEMELERARRLNMRAELSEWLMSAEMLILDDIQICEGSDVLQRELFALLNRLISRNRPLVISSDVPPTRLESVEDRLLSRLGGGVIVQLRLGEAAERREILGRMLHGHDVAPDVLAYVAEHVTDSVRSLRAAATQLVALSESMDEPATLDLARAVVPRPDDLVGALVLDVAQAADEQREPDSDRSTDSGINVAAYREMLASAETEEEQSLALQIVLGQRLSHLRDRPDGAAERRRLEHALEMLRQGRIGELGQIFSQKGDVSAESPPRARTISSLHNPTAPHGGNDV